jgi:hypothetical protein
MNERIPDPVHDPDQRALDLQLDACLAEALGRGPSPGLEGRVAARVQQAQSTAGAAQARRRLWAAALVLGGAGVVAAVAFLKDRGAERPAAAPDRQEPEPPKQQDPQPVAAETQTRIDRLLRDLELPARRDAALDELAAIGSAALPAIDAALRGEAARNRAEVLGALQTARARCGVAAAKAAFGLPPEPVTLISDYSDNRVLAVAANFDVVWTLGDVFGAWDVELTPAGTILITEFSVSRVREVDRTGKTLWAFEKLKNPYDADRLPNGNTLIADTFAGRVIEVNPAGETVWKYDTAIRPFDCDRLPNGNTLIADVLQGRVIEVSPAGDIVWVVEGMNNVHDADRLPNGNTLITLRSRCAVIEVDRDGKEVWKIEGLASPSDADRLPNGNTLVAENTQVREFDAGGKVVWRKQMTWAVECGRY